MPADVKYKSERLDFTYLPGFAIFLRDHHLSEFVREQLKISREIEVPLLKYFESIPESQLIEMSKISSAEFLTFIGDNKIKEQIQDALNKWQSNQLPKVARDQIVAEDITLVSYMRKQAFLTFLPSYTSDPQLIINIIREIDAYILESETSSTNIYIQLLKDRITEEKYLKEKITNTSPGIVYVFDIIEQKGVYSDVKLYKHLGFTETELKEMGSSILMQLIHPDDLLALTHHIESLLSARDGEILSLECRVQMKNVGYRWHRSYDSVFLRTKSGQVWQSIGIIFDIQNEKSIAEQLQYREDELLEAQELSGMGSFEWDLATGKGVSTPQVMKILDLQKEHQFKDFLNKIHPTDKSRVQQAIEKAIEEHSIYDAEYRYLTDQSEKVLWSRGEVSFKEGRRVMKGTIMDITDRHYMLQRLQRSEELSKQAQAITHIGNYSWGLLNSSFTWSDELYRIYGLNPQSDSISYEIIGSYNHPDDVEFVKNSIQQSVKTHEPFNFYYRIILPDNTIKILHARGEVLVNESAIAYKLIGTAQDVTERQQLIERLQQSDDLYKQAQALTHIGNWVWELTTNKFTWSDELYRIFGLDVQSEEINLEKYLVWVHPADKDLISQHLSKPHDLYYRIVLADGSVKVIHGKGEVIAKEDGTPYKIIGTSQDVTEEKMVEKQLRDNQNFIQKIADATPSIIASYNINTGKYTFINQGLEKLLGYKPQQVLEEGVSFFGKLIHPDDVAQLMEKNARAIEHSNKVASLDDNEMITEFQYRLLHKNGQYRWFHTFGTVFDRNSNNQVEHVLNISLDITERVEAEQILFEKNLELQQSNASLKEFAYVASHDLQEPLRKISTFGDRLQFTQREKLDAEGKIYLEKIISSSIRMQQLINDLLSISMISVNKAFQPYSLQNILNEVLISLEHIIEQRKAVIVADSLPEVNIVPSQFRQLFQNLISNSIKFTLKDVRPDITINAKFISGKEVKQFNLVKANKYLQIVFSDNGIGFDKIFADKIFAIFQRLHNRSQYEGTGIGLAICKKIVENHGGVIFASAIEDKGASFTIIIPA